MIGALISGKLIKTPDLRTGKTGSHYTQFLLSVAVGEEQPVIGVVSPKTKNVKVPGWPTSFFTGNRSTYSQVTQCLSRTSLSFAIDRMEILMLLRFTAIFITFAMFPVSCYAIDVTRTLNNENTVLLTGPIVSGDLKKIIAAVIPPATFPKYFTLDSQGGDIVEAMAIGRFIRETASGTHVTKNCASACVFILIAGVSRTALPSAAVGLHRPYYEPREFAGLSLSDAEKKYKILHDVTRRYLEEMEMPSAAIEKMFSISSDDVYYITTQDKDRLLVEPSAYSEWIRAKCSPPTASETELFKARGYNIYDRFNDQPPTDPEFVAFISKYDQSNKCESDLVRDVRQEVLRKNGYLQTRLISYPLRLSDYFKRHTRIK
jgi:ATP-dependent protease ClpP protease subunit